ncbi:hypothetical protein [Candidatus Bealeia paramacronuclearis]|uniref:hypothetical protein n=1 Tax=Candidatus Bealeia paramacronuclearis TaxID=1921001 RepID=UPI002F262AEF
MDVEEFFQNVGKTENQKHINLINIFSHFKALLDDLSIPVFNSELIESSNCKIHAFLHT